jgi:hypothetical protein
MQMMYQYAICYCCNPPGEDVTSLHSQQSFRSRLPPTRAAETLTMETDIVTESISTDEPDTAPETTVSKSTDERSPISVAKLQQYIEQKEALETQFEVYVL